jgi:hypothetical protein
MIALSLVANAAIFHTPAATAQGSGVVRIGSWDSGNALEPFEKSIELFEEKYPDIDVQLEAVPQEYGTKMLAQIAAGTAPDIIQVGDGDVATIAMASSRRSIRLSLTITADGRVLSGRAGNGQSGHDLPAARLAHSSCTTTRTSRQAGRTSNENGTG